MHGRSASRAGPPKLSRLSKAAAAAAATRRCWLSGPRCGSLFSHPLCPLPSPTLQEYTRARILQFAQAFAARLNPTVAPSVVQQAALDCLQALPPPDYSGVALEHRDLQLVFRHDCL